MAVKACYLGFAGYSALLESGVESYILASIVENISSSVAPLGSSIP